MANSSLNNRRFQNFKAAWISRSPFFLPVFIWFLAVQSALAALPGDYRIQKLPLLLSDGTALSASILAPDTYPGDSKIPAVLIFGGLERAAEVLELIKPTRKILLASFDYPVTFPRKLRFPESLKFAPEAKRGAHQTLEGISKLSAALALRDDVDPGRILIVGASFGAPFALVAAGNDPRFRGVVIAHGFGDVPGMMIHRLSEIWGKRYGVWTRPFAVLLSKLGWLYLGFPDPEEAARKLRPHQRVLLMSAERDQFIPAHITDSLWSAIQESKAVSEHITIPGEHLMPGADALIATLIRETEKWLDRWPAR